MLNTCVNFSTNKTSIYSIVLNTFVHFKTIKNYLFQCVKRKFVHFNTIKKCLFQCDKKHKFVHFNTIKNGLFQWVENMCLIWCNPCTRVYFSAEPRCSFVCIMSVRSSPSCLFQRENDLCLRSCDQEECLFQWLQCALHVIL